MMTGCDITEDAMNDGAWTAQKGLMNLETYPFEQNGIVPLDGEWEFYWKQWLHPADFRDAFGPDPHYMEVPSDWGKHDLDGKKLSREGYGTYRLIIQFPEGEAGHMKAIYMPEVATAYTIWINGKQAASTGQVGKNKDEMIPKSYPRVLYFQPDTAQVELVIQVSDFYQRKSGIVDSVLMGNPEAIALLRDQRVALEMVIIGILSIMALHHFSLFFSRKKDLSSFYFASICLAIAVRKMTLGEVLIVRFFLPSRWNWCSNWNIWEPFSG